MRAFVLSGGASLGAIQVGSLLALAEAGIRPDVIVGTSVGAVNGGWIAARGDRDGVAELARIWRSLRRADVFPTRPLIGLRGFLGLDRYMVPSAGLRRLLREHLTFRRLEDAPTPLHVVATDVLTGMDVLISTGDATEAILASAAIPAVFPPVRLGERDLIDGGVVNNTPISHAVRLGAQQVWVLSTGYACAPGAPPRGVLGMALHALSLLVNQRLADDIERYEAVVELCVVPPLCPVRVSPTDFSRSGELIDRAYRGTRSWLESGWSRSGQAELLALHEHDT